MMDIIALTACLDQALTRTLVRQLSCIIVSMLSMTGRVTMLGISRWSGKGGSYRTIQRFYQSATLPWLQIQWLFIRHHLSNPGDVILLAGDETTVTKSGKKTYGLDRFFSSIYARAVPGLSFFSLSLISVKHHTAYPILTEQVIKEASDEKTEPTEPKGKPGRPKGSRNKNKKDVELSPNLIWMRGLIQSVLSLIGTDLSIIYFVYDGAFGNNACTQMVRQCGLHLISKLKYNSALYFPYQGSYGGQGARKKYGDKLDYADIPETYIKESSIEGAIQTTVYQMHLWHKLFADLLNIVIIVKTNLETGETARIVLFSTDLDLCWDRIIHYYHLRFQIEFTFREAKQYWGLEDFMNIKQVPVYNAANLALFMVNVSQTLRRSANGEFSVNDLKAYFRGRRYAQEFLKQLHLDPDIVSIDDFCETIEPLGSIHPRSKAA